MEESRTRKTKKNFKKLILIAILGVVLISTTAVLILSPSNPTQTDGVPLFNKTVPNKSVYDSTGDLNFTKFVENELVNVPNDCYIVYADAKNATNNDTVLYFYPQTVSAVLHTPFVGNHTTAFKRFMYLPETEMYFFNHCNFYDTKKYDLPAKFDPTLGVNETHEQKQLRINLIKSDLLRDNNFTSVAQKADNIVDLAQYFLMTPKEVTDKMLQTGVLSLERDCVKGGFSPDSTVYSCKWKKSTWYYDKESGSVLLEGSQ